MEDFKISPIAHIESDFTTKFGIPRQAGIVSELQSRIVFEKEYRDIEAFRGIEDFSHIWVIWQFSENLKGGWSPTVRPPRLGGNERKGVFATRSPFRPNALGLSCLRLIRLEKDKNLGPVLYVAGADLMDGTPIFDIKPYVLYADCHPDALSGFAPDGGKTLEVKFAENVEKVLPEDKAKALRGVLANDPRPRYQNDPERIYAMEFGGFEVKFSVEGETLTVISIEK